jgi:hypothetical protein
MGEPVLALTFLSELRKTTSAPEPEFRGAVASDREAVLEILDDAARWLVNRGIHQWPWPFPRFAVDRDLEHNAAWLAVINGSIVVKASVLSKDSMFRVLRMLLPIGARSLDSCPSRPESGSHSDRVRHV